MMSHPAGTRREYGHVGATFLLHAKLVGLDTLADLIIGDSQNALVADMVRIGGDGGFLGIAPVAYAGGSGGVMAVAINDHDAVSAEVEPDVALSC